MIIKRILDILVATIALLLFSPLLLLIASAVYMKLGAPFLFRQARPGLNGIPFTMYKFRSMTQDRDARGNLLSDAARMTPLGHFLRSSSLDELPELINVLKGDMSLVGPRPLLMHYLELYDREQIRRHALKPGITGWAQVNGRNAIGWAERFRLDLWYVDNRSLGLDLKIIALTIIKAIKREGINQPGNATVAAFRGAVEQA